MRFRNGLALFEKCSGRGAWNVASFHSPHSMTWSWLLSFQLPRRAEGRWFWFQRSTLGQEKWSLQFFKFRLGWSTQEPMWYHDLYSRLYERQEIAEGRMWPGSAYQPPPPLPTVIDTSTTVRH